MIAGDLTFSIADVEAVAKCVGKGEPTLAIAYLDRVLRDKLERAPVVYLDGSAQNTWRQFKRPPTPGKNRAWGGRAAFYLQAARLVCIEKFPQPTIDADVRD